MQESFYRMICQIGTFMICAQAIIHFRPRESYGKYLKMLLSLMILVQIFQPFRNIFFGSTAQDFQNRIAYFQAEMEVRMQAATESAKMSEQKLQEMTLLELQERLEEQAQLEMQDEQERLEEQAQLEMQGEQMQSEEQTRQEGETSASEDSIEEDSVEEDSIEIEEVEIKVEWDAGEE